ncbi:restriction endonuclease, type II-like superfamily protein isoform X2 [Tasmannia lanceolata]
MNHSCFSQFRTLHLKAAPFLPARKEYNGDIPWSCSTSSSAPLTLRAPSSLVVASTFTPSNAPQRSEEWFALRKDRLTTSTFSTALGFWKGNRRSMLWHEKVFTPDAQAFEATAKAAMEWGVLHESAAIEKYKCITGRNVDSLGFATPSEEKFGWLGASPDGVLGCFPDGGILEVKCPFNKGKPNLGLPWAAVPYYYMPQVQGLMEIMNREWVDLYCWTPNGSSLFRVLRKRNYWALIHGVLREFWWESVVPAREAVLMGREADAKVYEPKPRHPQTGLVIAKSIELAAESKLVCKDIGGHLEFYS